VYCGEKFKNGNYAVGTINGLFVFDQYFNIISHFGIDNGLQDSFVRSIHEDMQGNIWLGLNDGISKINFSSKVKKFEKIKSKIDFITNYIGKFNNNLYFATSKGINKSFVNHKNFRQYFLPLERDKIQGQTWSLLNFDEKNLIVASRWGLDHINKNDFYKRFF
jgi:AraC family transcriptional regulator, chitin signaling transcriptional activator